MDSGKGTVCVTGATGFVASWLIKRLLEGGYTVRGTIRRRSGGTGDLGYLTDLPGAAERLRLVHADLGDPESFEAAVDGCVGVFHTAHPIDIEDREPEAVVTKRAVDGTLGILKASLKAKTVRRVIYTGSAANVIVNTDPEEIADETSWSDVDFIRGTGMPLASYILSKVLTEKAAQEFAEGNGLDMVTLIPPYVTGPFLCPRLPASALTTMAMIFGKAEYYGSLLRISMVHVDDLASAYIFLFEKPEARGRYICCGKIAHIDEIATLLSTKYPEYPIPSEEEVKQVQGYKSKGISSKRLLDAGFQFRHDLDGIYTDAVLSCKEKGIL